MILNPKNTTVAYRCPECGATVVSMVGIFALSGDRIVLKCNCGNSALTMTHTQDHKIRMEVPCILCPHPHPYLLSENAFFEKQVLSLPCAYTGTDICFIGEEDAVLQAAREADEILAGMLEEAGLDNVDRLRQENPAGSPQEPQEGLPILGDILRFLLQEMQEEGTIHCRCGNEQTPEYGFELIGEEGDTVRVFCRTCGASDSFLISDTYAANAFLHIDTMTLK